MRYKHDKEANNIVFSEPIKKGRDNIKVYFYRLKDERESIDYPICTCCGDGTDTYGWTEGFEILTIHVRQPKWFGILKGKWEIVDKD